MVPSDWDSAPSCLCGPNFISDLIGESQFYSGESENTTQTLYSAAQTVIWVFGAARFSSVQSH